MLVTFYSCSKEKKKPQAIPYNFFIVFSITAYNCKVTENDCNQYTNPAYHFNKLHQPVLKRKISALSLRRDKYLKRKKL